MGSRPSRWRHGPLVVGPRRRQPGFHIDRHNFESTLDLAARDDPPFAGALERERRAGIDLFTPADRDDTEEARRLWARNERLRDAPMLAVNRKLDLRPEPGSYRVLRCLA